MKKDNIEVEIRLKVDDIKRLRKELRNLGLKCKERWQGRDILFDKGNELTPNGIILRLRITGKNNKKAKLTYKGPYQNHILKKREEIETIVENPLMALKILENLGYLPIIQYEKQTELWEYNKVEIYLDEMPRIGVFLEI